NPAWFRMSLAPSRQTGFVARLIGNVRCSVRCYCCLATAEVRFHTLSTNYLVLTHAGVVRLPVPNFSTVRSARRQEWGDVRELQYRRDAMRETRELGVFFPSPYRQQEERQAFLTSRPAEATPSPKFDASLGLPLRDLAILQEGESVLAKRAA